ncbi:endonuclease YncB(thermonuclease family) [Pararhizobium capsulatum DSM 1112]|uniref:Endonuclease YncB(Thermonuclease family) n=1 Tax=Pararhizobium capsulatum DSM 1112 TaxID=1121113 RepID=A0ABU0BKT2_9HYPH|nr:thermonuclease family protein [Pararhizobium capsulatum]MDQ0318855.1 endonuclease YncB(thermonuclease family) [Pararhizobium capsulatum DSM 1112]
MKRQLLTLAGGLGAIGLTALILLAGNATIQGTESAATPEFTLDTPTMEDMGTAEEQDDVPALPDATAPTPDTSVESEPLTLGTPDDVTSKPLERIEPRKPLSETMTKPEPGPQVLRHPVALSAGTIRFGNGTLQLEGLGPQSAERQCGEGTSAWPCGTVARTAFRNFLRARAMTCAVPDASWEGTVTARCSIGDIDPAQWLAENGWAEPAANSAFADSIRTAQTEKRGFYGDDPRDEIVEPFLMDDTAEPADALTEPAQ